MRVFPLLKTNGPEKGTLRMSRQTVPGIIPMSANFEFKSGKLQETKNAFRFGVNVISEIKVLI